MNIRENKGITLVALVITIIVLIIISGISITGTVKNQKEAQENVQITELTMIQHAVLERYIKAQLTKEQLPGAKIDKQQVETIVNEINTTAGTNINLKGTEYFQLNNEDLKKIGITGNEDIYIVNYKTGEVINKTVKVTNSGEALYIYSKNEE